MAIEAHIIPINDQFEHETTDDCPCGPKTLPAKRDDGSYGWAIIHQTLLGKETNGTTRRYP